jgi:hypothetical protein
MAELTETGPKVTKIASPTRVRVGIKFLKNLGNFENVTLDFEIDCDVLPNETTDAALDRVYDKVNEHLGKRLRELLADHK